MRKMLAAAAALLALVFAVSWDLPPSGVLGPAEMVWTEANDTLIEGPMNKTASPAAMDFLIQQNTVNGGPSYGSRLLTHNSAMVIANTSGDNPTRKEARLPAFYEPGPFLPTMAT